MTSFFERIGRLKEKSRGIAQHHPIEILPEDSGKRARAIHWQPLPVKGSLVTGPDLYCLHSYKTQWDEEIVWRTYTMRADLGAVCRSLKSELGLRPIFHHTETRCEGHLFITVLAYQLDTPSTRRPRHFRALGNVAARPLTTQCRVTVIFSRPDGRTLHVRKATRAEPEQGKIYRALGADPSPGVVFRKCLCETDNSQNKRNGAPLAEVVYYNYLIILKLLLWVLNLG